MRNKFIIIVIFICSFLFVDKVSAANLKYDYTHEKLQVLDEYKYVIDETINIAETYNTKDTAFLITANANGIRFVIFGGTGDTWNYSPYFNTDWRYIYFDYRGIENYVAKYDKAFADYSSISFTNINDSEKLEEFYSKIKNIFLNGSNNQLTAFSTSSVSKAVLNILDNTSYSIILYSNIPIKYVQSQYTQYNDTLQINDTVYNYGDTIPTYYDYAYIPKIPEILTYTENTLYNDDNELIQLKIHVNWKIKDLNKYQYRFKTQNNNNYHYFFDDEVENEVIVNANDIYTFEITDLDGNIIDSQTVNIDLINNNVLPTLKLNDYTGIGCYYNNQQICAILTLYSDNADFSKYTLQYRFTEGEWITHNYENSAKGQIVIYENTTITARLIRNSDNKLIDSTSHTITKIDPNIKFDVPTFKWDKLFCTNMSPNEWHEIGQGNFKQTLKLTIYGLDMSKYRVFVSTDGANKFDEIIQFDYEDRVPLVKYYYFEYYEDTSLIVKITDLEGNYVTAATFNLHFTCNDVDIKLGDINDMNDVFKTVTNFFDKFKNIMMKIKEVIEYFYNSLNGEIKAFILTAFILIIVLNLIMRMMK